MDYTVDPGRRSNHYRVESYFFIPRNLGVSRRTYSRDHFYRDIKAYIRFKSPDISLAALRNGPDCLLSVLRRQLELNKNSRSTPEILARLLDNLKLFGCIVRSNVLRELSEIQRAIETNEVRPGESTKSAEQLESSCSALLSDLRLLLAEFRALRPGLTKKSPDDPVLDAFANVDEFVSVVVEERLTYLLGTLDQLAGTDTEFLALRSTGREMIIAEQQHRSAEGYPAVIQTDSQENEKFLYRVGVLKKFVMSVLWLEVDKEQKAKRWADFGAAIAAGLAMAFAVTATILQSQVMALNTWSFLLPAVLVYILKDRIKDWVKAYFSRTMTRWVADYDIKILDPHNGVQVGRCLEAFSYLSDAQIPDDVYSLRHRRARTSVDKWAQPEVVLKYEKDVQLTETGFVPLMARTTCDLHDILRFDISHVLGRADDPESQLPYFDAGRDRVVLRTLPKVYHLNLILVLTSEDSNSTMARLRVVLDKDGIRRLEEISWPEGIETTAKAS